MKTLICQSFRIDDQPAWIAQCLSFVRHWSDLNGYDYRFEGDRFLERVPDWFRDKAGGCLPVVSDLARLLMMRDGLEQGYDRVVWLDADVLIFAPERLILDDTLSFAFGREVWIQASAGELRSYRNVHNAICLFAKGNPFLDFYIDSCLRLMRRMAADGMTPQFLGPKFLTAQHNMIGFDLIDRVGMFSPLVVRDIVSGGGPALDKQTDARPAPLAAANLCHSMTLKSYDGVALDADGMSRAVSRLLAEGRHLFTGR